ncbi:hypothetical protein ASE09_04435 [Streptomyces sp. Root66D1]|nr:hypothetical protein ASD33_04430 [Streptomyces sp. Root1304]KRB00777.1 hypothetical protein ASE09_04435 [Streptomyces sp. Root66D1]
MRTSGLNPLFHRVGGATAQGGQRYRGRLVIAGQQRFQHMPFHGHLGWIVRAAHLRTLVPVAVSPAKPDRS